MKLILLRMYSLVRGSDGPVLRRSIKRRPLVLNRRSYSLNNVNDMSITLNYNICGSLQRSYSMDNMEKFEKRRTSLNL